MFTPKVARGNPSAKIIRVAANRWRNKSPDISPLTDKNWHGQAIQALPQEERDNYDDAVDTPPPPARRTEFYVIARSHEPGLELAPLRCVSLECDDQLLEQAYNRGWTALRWAAADKPLLRILGPLLDAEAFKELVAQEAPILDDPFHDRLARERILRAYVDLDRDPLD